MAVVAPEAVGLTGLLVPLGFILAALVMLGMTHALHAISVGVVGTIGKVVGWIPFIGGVLSSPVNSVVHWMDHAFSTAEQGLDGALAFWLHQLTALWHWLGAEIEANAHWLWLLTNLTLGTAFATVVYSELGRIRHAAAAVEQAGIDALRGIDRLARSLPSQVESLILPRLRPLEHALEHVVYPDIAGLRARTRDLLDRLDHVWQQLRKVDALLGTAALTGAVAVVLTRLDLNWIRCRNWNRLGKAGCSLPLNLIEDLLGIGLAYIAVVDPVVIAEEADALIGVLSPVIEEIAA